MVTIGSARINEKGKVSGGNPGDQLQNEARDTRGEVSYQTFYIHSKGWYVFRAKSDTVGHELAKAMRRACKNKNVGYSQTNRLAIMKDGTDSKVPTECDCSSLVRRCILEASSRDLGNMTTADMPTVLERSGLFYSKQSYNKNLSLANGDILVTQSKGHTAIVVGGGIKRYV